MALLHIYSFFYYNAVSTQSVCPLVHYLYSSRPICPFLLHLLCWGPVVALFSIFNLSIIFPANSKIEGQPVRFLSLPFSQNPVVIRLPSFSFWPFHGIVFLPHSLMDVSPEENQQRDQNIAICLIPSNNQYPSQFNVVTLAICRRRPSSLVTTNTD